MALPLKVECGERLRLKTWSAQIVDLRHVTSQNTAGEGFFQDRQTRSDSPNEIAFSDDDTVRSLKENDLK